MPMSAMRNAPGENPGLRSRTALLPVGRLGNRVVIRRGQLHRDLHKERAKRSVLKYSIAFRPVHEPCLAHSCCTAARLAIRGSTIADCAF